MKVPTCRVLAIGELSTWGKQFLTNLETNSLAEVHYEASVQTFCSNAAPQARITVLFAENLPDSRQAIQRLRVSPRRFFLVWFGRAFTKEDLAFAIEHRVYCVFEQSRADEKKIAEAIGRIGVALEMTDQFEQMIHSLKALLLQAETDVGMLPLVNEIKTALSKLERTGLYNEFSGGAENKDGNEKDSKLPFHKAQGFGDALSTVHNLERTGVLWVRGGLPGQEGKVEFLQGKIIAAQAGDIRGGIRGLKAIYRMFLWDEPRFLFTRRDPQSVTFEEQIEQSMKYICMEGEELSRRFSRIRHELPPAEIKLELEPSSLHSGTQLSSEDFSTLSSVIEFGHVGQVLNYNLQPDVNIYESLIRLKKNKLIRVAA